MFQVKNFFFILSFTFLFCQGFGGDLKHTPHPSTSSIETFAKIELSLVNSENDTLTKKEFNKIKFTAITLAVTLGVFGVHRLYLGTSPRVPIVYTLTLGGGFFLLPLSDIVYIISAKDVDQLQNNDYIFMWNKKKKTS